MMPDRKIVEPALFVFLSLVGIVILFVSDDSFIVHIVGGAGLGATFGTWLCVLVARLWP